MCQFCKQTKQQLEAMKKQLEDYVKIKAYRKTAVRQQTDEWVEAARRLIELQQKQLYNTRPLIMHQDENSAENGDGRTLLEKVVEI